ncbi:hypothetical protein GP486_001786 [Trichoglossum hirsutum]|uniref:F-box domain-containing protein n=1 Tax=Trichoglossum hirsutum TaxID=265104 RepID=A0A9P8RSD1_9PEZI|nr:hypothetical protein GP486_001786 [Trichoglossum hirsutum]
MVTEAGTVSTTLLDLLSNTLILHRTSPYLSISALSSLAATSTAFQNLVYNTPLVFRHLDLTDLASTAGPPARLGGTQWSTPRGCAITKEGVYPTPLRAIFSRFYQVNLLKDIQTLILDGLSVTAELVQEIICDASYNVRILSIREVKDLDERKLMQVLNYAVRPSRAPDTPKLKGLYIFGPRDPEPLPMDLTLPARSPFGAGSFSAFGAQIGPMMHGFKPRAECYSGHLLGLPLSGPKQSDLAKELFPLMLYYVEALGMGLLSTTIRTTHPITQESIASDQQSRILRWGLLGAPTAIPHRKFLPSTASPLPNNFRS